MANKAMTLFGRKTTRRSVAKPIIIRTGGGLVRRRAGAFAKTLGKAARTQAVQEKVAVHALIGAAALGAVERSADLVAKLPKVEALGLSGTYGLALFAAGKLMKSRVLVDASVGVLACAVRDLVKGAGVEGATEGVSGGIG